LNRQEASPEGLADAGFALMLKGDFVKMADEWFSRFDPQFIGQDKLNVAKRQFVTQLPLVRESSGMIWFPGSCTGNPWSS